MKMKNIMKTKMSTTTTITLTLTIFVSTWIIAIGLGSSDEVGDEVGLIVNIIFVTAALVIAINRRVAIGYGFAITTGIMPMIGFFWAIFGKHKYYYWDKEEIMDANYIDLKKAVPHISSDLKEFARDELAKKRPRK